MKRYTFGLLVCLALLTGCEENSINEVNSIEQEAPNNNEANIEKNGQDADKNPAMGDKEPADTLAPTPDPLPKGEEVYDEDPIYNDKLLTITNSKILDEIQEEASKYNEEEINFLKKFMIRWTFKDQPNVFLDFHEHFQFNGVTNGQLITRGEFSVSEINLEEQFIILHIFIEHIDNNGPEQNPEQREYYNKLYLKNNGEELHYVHDYLDQKYESTWISK